eukprot:4437025-Pleurochrysis_carterae.AAC.2
MAVCGALALGALHVRSGLCSALHDVASTPVDDVAHTCACALDEAWCSLTCSAFGACDVPPGQMRFSLFNLERELDGTLETCLELGVVPVAQSPLAGARRLSRSLASVLQLRRFLPACSRWGRSYWVVLLMVICGSPQPVLPNRGHLPVTFGVTQPPLSLCQSVVTTNHH